VGNQFAMQYLVYVDHRDVTQWVTRLVVEQAPRTLYRRFEVTVAGWNLEEVTDGSRWDIFGSLDVVADPHAVCLIRDGYVPPDKEQTALVKIGDAPSVTFRGYDYAWVMMRRSPRDTIVMVPGTGLVWATNASGERYLIRNDIQVALDEYRSQNHIVGQYQVWYYVSTLESACNYLAQHAGCSLEYRMPGYNMQAWVVSPAKSYWETLLELVEPYAPDIYYRRDRNTLVIADSLASQYTLGFSKVTLPAGALENIKGVPDTRKRVRRVLVRIP
jgi:hypothetical protein